jgi:hypothetical protein
MGCNYLKKLYKENYDVSNEGQSSGKLWEGGGGKGGSRHEITKIIFRFHESRKTKFHFHDF